VLGARQDPASRLWVFVDLRLQVREQIWHVLDLVEHGAVGVISDEAPWVRPREAAVIDSFEVDVWLTYKYLAAQGRLAGLPRPGDRNDRILLRHPLQDRSEVPADHDALIVTCTYNSCKPEAKYAK